MGYLYLIEAFVGSLGILLLLLRTSLVNLALDQPNQRSLHTKLTPRTGGIAIMVGLLLSWATSGQSWFWLLPVMVLFMISIIDDSRNISICWRFSIQLLVCALFVMYMSLDISWWILGVLTISLVWMTNLYNFMDGSDGLAGGMALFGFSSYAVAAHLGQDFQLSVMSASISAASLAFLIFNFYPAKIFMGDGGSIPLGFLAASIGFYGWQHQLWSLWFPILVFSPFIVDATVTLLKRVYGREKFWQAHRKHYYQRLVQMGWGHKKTAIYEYFLMMAVAISALLLKRADNMEIWLGLLVWIVIYGFILQLIDRRWKQFQHVVAVIR